MPLINQPVLLRTDSSVCIPVNMLALVRPRVDKVDHGQTDIEEPFFSGKYSLSQSQ